MINNLDKSHCEKVNIESGLKAIIDGLSGKWRFDLR